MPFGPAGDMTLEAEAVEGNSTIVIAIAVLGTSSIETVVKTFIDISWRLKAGPGEHCLRSVTRIGRCVAYAQSPQTESCPARPEGPVRSPVLPFGRRLTPRYTPRATAPKRRCCNVWCRSMLPVPLRILPQANPSLRQPHITRHLQYLRVCQRLRVDANLVDHSFQWQTWMTDAHRQ